MPGQESYLDILVSPDMRIIEAFDALNRAHKRIILVADEEQRLLGVITDSDLRHAVLDKVNLESRIDVIMRKKPVTVPEAAQNDEILQLMETTTCYQVPVVDQTNRIVGIRFIDEILKDEHLSTNISTAVIMAGGMGTRLYPLTNDKPKPLLEVGGQPLLFTILDQLIKFGFSPIYLTLNFRGDDIENLIANETRFAEHVQFVHESKRLGTAGPLSLLPTRPDGPFLVMNGDLLTKVAIDEMIRFHHHERNVMTVALREEKHQVPYGVARLEGTRLLGMTEKPEFTYFINAGVYIIEPYALDRIPADSFFDMTTLIDDLIKNDLRVGSFPVHEYWLDIGEPHQLAQAEREFAREFKREAGNEK